MNVKTYNQAGEEAGTVELPDTIFGLPWNADLVHQVVTSQEANRRPKVAHVKNRAEVRGGGRKPWRQKGTGRARHGSTRSPIWRGGGVTHGPTEGLNYRKKINKKMARKALRVVLSAKIRDGEVIVMENMELKEAKTKFAAQIFKNLAKRQELDRVMLKRGALVILPEKKVSVKRALRNLPYAGAEEARNLTAYDVLQYKYILFPRSEVEALNK